jgi:hypothetical protein
VKIEIKETLLPEVRENVDEVDDVPEVASDSSELESESDT